MQKIAQAMGSTFNMGELAPPATWKNDTTRNDAQHISVASDSAEYKMVVGEFEKSLPKNQIRVKSVKRIENTVMWQSYAVKLAAMRGRDSVHDYQRVNNKGGIERAWLFHGTHADVVPKIAQQGFNRAFAGRNATRWGKGVYFARDAA